MKQKSAKTDIKSKLIFKDFKFVQHPSLIEVVNFRQFLNKHYFERRSERKVSFFNIKIKRKLLHSLCQRCENTKQNENFTLHKATRGDKRRLLKILFAYIS